MSISQKMTVNGSTLIIKYFDVYFSKKIGPGYYGPYKVLARVGQVAYILEMWGSQVHITFYVSCLKKMVGKNVKISNILPPIERENKPRTSAVERNLDTKEYRWP